MIGNNNLCSICNSENAVHACICYKQVKLLGSACTSVHLLDSYVAHELVSVELGLRMLQDSAVLDKYDFEIIKASELVNQLKKYEQEIGKYKLQLLQSKEIFVSQVDQVFEEVLNKLINARSDLMTKLGMVFNYRRSLSQEGVDLLEAYNEKGYRGVFREHIQGLHIDVDDVVSTLRNKIRIECDCIQPEIDTVSQENQQYDKQGLMESVDILKKIISEKDLTIEELKRTIHNFQQELFQKDKVALEAEKSRNDIEKKIKLLQASLNQFKVEANATKLEHNESLKTLKKEKRLLDEQLKSQYKLASVSKHQYEESLKTLKKEKSHLEEQLKTKEEVINSVEHQYEESLKTLNKEKSLLEEQLKSQDKLINSVKDMENEIKSLKTYNTKSQEKIKTLTAQNKKIPKNLKRLMNFKQIQDCINRLNTNSYKEDQEEICEEDNRYIYNPVANSKGLLKLDVISGGYETIFLSSLSKYFTYTSTCVLDNGDVLCTGFGMPSSNDAYLYKVDTQKCIKLPNLNTQRLLISLFNYRNYVYAFGGMNESGGGYSIAERLNISNKTWEKLTDMKYARSWISCIGIEDNIYLFTGSNKVIEVFNTISLQFQAFKLDNSESKVCNGVACKYKDRVYLITHTYIQVYDLSLKKLAQYENTYKYDRYTIYNIVTYNNSIYFYNYHTLLIEKISTSFSESWNKLDQSQQSYVYKARENLQELHKINLESQTIEAIDLSKSIYRNFSNTSVCILPSGDVFIAGFSCPLDGACYMFNPDSNTCSRIQDIATPRFSISLLYYQGYIYAFGGETYFDTTLKTAERFELASGRWIRLSNMIRPRRLASCIGIENKIYLFGGSKESVEIYDILTNSYSLCKLVLYEHLIAVNVSDLIYVIGENNYTILNSNLDILEQTQDTYHTNDLIFSLTNIVVYKGSIYFCNHKKAILEKFNIQTRERGIAILNSKQTPVIPSYDIRFYLAAFLLLVLWYIM